MTKESGLPLPGGVVVREVGPRDGLQSLKTWVPTEEKISLINRLSRTGLQRIEATSFVHPKAIPQMRDADDVMAGIDRVEGVRYEALVPNVKGAERALENRVDQIGVFISATEAHNRANVRRSIEESLSEVPAIVKTARAGGVSVRGSVVTAFGCPYEGEVSMRQVFRLLEAYVEAGISEVLLGDTTGMGNPCQVYEMVGAIRRDFPEVSLTLHFHDTRGTGLANVLAGLETGATTFDAAVGGLGGCPYAPGATGNIATEDLVYMLEEMGVKTGVDLDLLLECARWVTRLTENTRPSHLVQAGRPVRLATGEN